MVLERTILLTDEEVDALISVASTARQPGVTLASAVAKLRGARGKRPAHDTETFYDGLKGRGEEGGES